MDAEQKRVKAIKKQNRPKWMAASTPDGSALSSPTSGSGYGTFRLNFHHFDRFELDLRGYIHVRGAAFSCLRLQLADIVLI